MRKFCSIVKLTFLTNFAYIKAFWLNIVGTAVSIIVYYFLWQFVFQKQDTIAGFTMEQMTTYAVSYTHLDVYKRQCLNRTNLQT